MIRTQVYLPEVIKKKKKAKGKFDPWREFVGAGRKGGIRDLSSKIDYYLYVKPYENKKKWA